MKVKNIESLLNHDFRDKTLKELTKYYCLTDCLVGLFQCYSEYGSPGGRPILNITLRFIRGTFEKALTHLSFEDSVTKSKLERITEILDE